MPNATKATATRRPAKKTTPAETAPTPEAAATPDKAPGTIEFMGRVMKVGTPTAERIDVWERTVAQMQTLTEATPKAEQRRLLSRGIKVIRSVLADEADKDWIDDQFLEGNLTLEKAVDIIGLAVDEYPAMFAEKAPRTGPAPKARRR